MIFFKSKVGKLYSAAFIITVLLTLGSMKMGGIDSSQLKGAQKINNEQAETENISAPEALEKAKKAHDEGDLQNALKYYKIATNSEDTKIKSTALSSMGSIYMQYNDSKNIIETYENLLKIEQDRATRKKAYVNLAETYKFIDSYDKAIEMYKESYNISKNPNDVLKLCDLYEKVSDERSIRKVLKAHLKMYPEQAIFYSKYKKYLNADAQEEIESIEQKYGPQNPNTQPPQQDGVPKPQNNQPQQQGQEDSKNQQQGDNSKPQQQGDNSQASNNQPLKQGDGLKDALYGVEYIPDFDPKATKID